MMGMMPGYVWVCMSCTDRWLGALELALFALIVGGVGGGLDSFSLIRVVGGLDFFIFFQ